MKYRGCAYYPEYWGVERVETDAKLMRDAAINIVRIGEFAWSRMEPEEGRYDFGWLHETLDILARYGISAIICTPTATPPAWLHQRYPEAIMTRPDGRKAEHGGRRHYCHNSESFKAHSARITDVLSREMARHANVVGWQLDNEFGPECGHCYCDACQARFREWLKARYGTPEGLNRAWKTGFWSVDYTSWSQVCLDNGRAEQYSAHKLDEKRFRSDMYVEFANAQAEIIRRNHPGAIIQTNGMGPLHDPIDYYTLFGGLDVACDDLYFDIAPMHGDALAMDVYRNLKPGKRFWITETGSGALDHGIPPSADQFRAWMWSAFAHGSDGHFIFRWRTALSGQEQELQGILDHSGRPRHRYQAVKRAFTEIAALEKRFADLPLPRAEVAIVQDYQTLWAYQSSRIGREIDYTGLIFDIHKRLRARDLVVDIVPPSADLSGYKAVVLPSLMMISDKFAESLRKFVEEGGRVLALGQLAMRDANDNYLEQTPTAIAELAGATIEGGIFLRSHVAADEALWGFGAKERETEVALACEIDGASATGKAAKWLGDIVATDGTPILKVADPGCAFDGQPAGVTKRTGRGRFSYVAAGRLDDTLLEALIDTVLGDAGVAPGPRTEADVEVIERGDITFAINHNPTPTVVTLACPAKAIVGECSGKTIHLPPYGVCVAERG